MKKEVVVEGLKCAGCASTVKERFSTISGIQAVEVNLESKTATIESATDVSNETLQQSLDGTKFKVVG